MEDYFGGLRIFWSYASGFQVPWEEATSVFLRQIILIVIPYIIYRYVLRGDSAIIQNFCAMLSPRKHENLQPWLQESRQQSMAEMCRFYVHTRGAM